MNVFTHFVDYLLTHPAVPLTVALGILLIYVFYLDHKIVVLTRGKNGASLEDTIHACLSATTRIEERNKAITTHAINLDTRISHALRNAQTLRYKAFDAGGSNQSFSIALVNEKGNGVVISSLHTHNRMSTFAKPIIDYKSTYELTEEELHVLEESKKQHMTDAHMV